MKLNIQNWIKMLYNPMKFLNSEELAKLIYLDYKGNNYNGYNFRISNSPAIRTNKEGKILSCTCKRHSIHGDKKPEKVYIIAKKNLNKEINFNKDTDLILRALLEICSQNRIPIKLKVLKFR